RAARPTPAPVPGPACPRVRRLVVSGSRWPPAAPPAAPALRVPPAPAASASIPSLPIPFPPRPRPSRHLSRRVAGTRSARAPRPHRRPARFAGKQEAPRGAGLPGRLDAVGLLRGDDARQFQALGGIAPLVVV